MVLSTAVLLLWGSQTHAQSLTAEQVAEAVANIENAMPDVTLTPSAAAWTRGARIVRWTEANSGTYREIDTEADARDRALEIKAAGFNTVLMSGRHYRQSYRTPELIQETHANAKLAVDACHLEGLKVIDHHDWTVFWSEGYDVTYAHPDWLQINVRHGRASRYYCVSNPAFVQDAIDYLEDFQNATGVDGYMIDEIRFDPPGCGCTHCRQAFYDVTGFSMPTDTASAALTDPTDPLWWLWRQWRLYALAHYRAQLVEALQEINPDAVLLNYATAYQHPIVLNWGGDIFTAASAAQFVGFEGTNTVYPGYADLMAQLSLHLAVAQARGRYAYAQLPGIADGERPFSAFLSAVTGQAPWMSIGSDLTPIFTWPKWEDLTHPRESLADVALIFSNSTRDMSLLAGWIQAEEFIGWAQTLGISGIPYESIINLAADSVDWSQYRVVVVPACDALDPALTHALYDFANDGGTVIVTGPVGRYDEHAFPVPYGFADGSRLGYSVRLQSIEPRDSLTTANHGSVGDGPVTITPTVDGQTVLGISSSVTLERGLPYLSNYVGPASGSRRILARYDADPVVGNAVIAVESAVGDGSIIHLSFLPGRATLQPRARLHTVFEDWVDAEAQQLILGLIGYAEEGGNRVTRITEPGIAGSIYGDGTTAVMHLLNVKGVGQNYAVGDVLTRANTNPVYPAITNTFDVVLSLPGLQSAVLHDPDQPASALTLNFTQEGGNYIVQVPAGSFTRYAAIELSYTP